MKTQQTSKFFTAASRRDFGFIFMIALLAILLSGCNAQLDRLKNVGKAPEMTPMTNPHTKPDYEPISWPLPNPMPNEARYAGSLWQPGSRTFFRDLRADRVGDIVRVQVQIDDSAELENETSRNRANTENLGAPTVFGLENEIFNWLPGNQNPAALASITGDSDTQSSGDIARGESVETTVAAIVTQKLPNGNFVIEGRQEVRVNHEVREVTVAGVIRPEDIDENNTIQHTQIAEARISYGGRGTISDVQQPRWGYEVIDVLSPF